MARCRWHGARCVPPRNGAVLRWIPRGGIHRSAKGPVSRLNREAGFFFCLQGSAGGSRPAGRHRLSAPSRGGDPETASEFYVTLCP